VVTAKNTVLFEEVEPSFRRTVCLHLIVKDLLANSHFLGFVHQLN